MSEERSPSWRLLACAIAGLLVCAPDQLATQDANAARAELRSVQRRHHASVVSTDSLRQSRTARLDDSLRAGGRLVRFNRASLASGDRERLVRGLEQAHEELITRWGPGGAALIDSLPWDLRSLSESVIRRSSARRLPAVRVTQQLRAPTPGGKALGLTFNSPLSPDDVTALALQAAGQQIARAHPTLAQFAPSISFEDSERVFASAAENLALSVSSVGARCAAGGVGACRAVLAPLRGASPRAVYFDPEDYREMVAASSSAKSRRDSSTMHDVARCLEHDRPACARVVARLPDRYPFREQVRSSFALHALQQGGPAGLDRLVASQDRYVDDPLGLLAYVSGQEEAALIRGWHERIRAAGALRAAPPLAPLVVTAVFWSGLLLIGATLRRPR